MVDKQPDALRLAGELSHPCDGLRWNDGDQLLPQAAAELRRLHAENENLRMTLRVEEACSFRTQMQQYAAQRDELLEALKEISAIENQEWGADWEEIEQARNIADAAITKAEGANND